MITAEIPWVWDGHGDPLKAVAEFADIAIREHARRERTKRVELAQALAISGVEDEAVITAALRLIAPHLPKADRVEPWQDYANAASKAFALENGLAHWTEVYDESDFEGNNRAEQATDAAKDAAADLLNELLGGTK